MNYIAKIARTEKALRRVLAATPDTLEAALSSYTDSILTNKETLRNICHAFEKYGQWCAEESNGTIIFGLYHWWIKWKLDALTD